MFVVLRHQGRINSVIVPTRVISMMGKHNLCRQVDLCLLDAQHSGERGGAVRWRQGAACGNRDIDLHESERQSTLTTAHCTTARDHYRTALAILSENWSVAAVATHNNLRPVGPCILHISLWLTTSNQLSGVLNFYIIYSLNKNSSFSSKFCMITMLCFIPTSIYVVFTRAKITVMHFDVLERSKLRLFISRVTKFIVYINRSTI